MKAHTPSPGWLLSRRATAPLLALLTLAVALTRPALAETPSKPTTGKEPAPSAKSLLKSAALAKAGPVEVAFSDGSTLKMTLKEERLEVKTAYGMLLIPVADLERIEFGRRIPADVAKKIEAAIFNLGSERFTVRETAMRELLALQEKAYPALVKAAGSGDREVARRIEEILARLRETIAKEKLEQPDHDVLHTRDMKITGRVLADTVKVNTLAFGEQNLRLADVRSLRLPGAVEPEPKDVLPDPSNLLRFQAMVGKTLHFRVTGGAPGAAAMAGPGGMGAFPPGAFPFAVGVSVYGTDLYTTDSSLAMAAVHAGVLKMGQTGVVKVTILGPQAAFAGSMRNGVNSMNYGPYPGAYKVSKVGR